MGWPAMADGDLEISDRDRFMRPEELAAYLGVKPKTLANWRSLGEGPPFVQLSRNAVGYLESAVLAWLKGRQVRSTTQAWALGLTGKDGAHVVPGSVRPPSDAV